MDIGKEIKKCDGQAVPYAPWEHPLVVPVPCPGWPSWPSREEGEEPIPVELPAKVPVEPSDA